MQLGPPSGGDDRPTRNGRPAAEHRRGVPMSMTTSHDPHAQLRALYQSLLSRQEHFDEFKRLLALYDVGALPNDSEPAEAAAVRQQLNARIRQWVGGQFDGLTAAQTLQWRAIVVEERFNVSLSPWKESNAY
jgi:hypothetical protein